ncbi:hypothetical protein B0H11DRAFT_1940150 [Mycena galericulata]|nr:hypothetical protein B0H11DRAFT_1940150 [Mycena galericulata]
MYTVPAAETVRIAEGTRRATLNDRGDVRVGRRRLVRLSRAKKTQDARSMHTNAHYLAGALRDIVHTREVNEGRPAHCMRQRVRGLESIDGERFSTRMSRQGAERREDSFDGGEHGGEDEEGGGERGREATSRRWWWYENKKHFELRHAFPRCLHRTATGASDFDKIYDFSTGSTNVLKIESQDVKSSKDNLNLEFWKRERINSDLSLTMSSR